MPKSSRQGQSKGLSSRTRSHDKSYDKINKKNKNKNKNNNDNDKKKTRNIIQSYTATGLALPKRPRGPLIIYSAEKRQKVANQNPDADGQEITRILGRQFNKLSAEKRKKFDDLAEKDSKRYRKEKKLIQQGVTRVPIDGPFEKEVARYHKKHPEEFGVQEDDDSDDDHHHHDHDHDSSNNSDSDDHDDNNDSDDDNNDSDDDNNSDDSDDDNDDRRRNRGRQQNYGRGKSQSSSSYGSGRKGEGSSSSYGYGRKGEQSSSTYGSGRKGEGYHGDHDPEYDGRRNNPGRPKKSSSKSSGSSGSSSGKKSSSKKHSGDFSNRVHADSNRYLKKNKDQYLPKYLDTDSD